MKRLYNLKDKIKERQKPAGHFTNPDLAEAITRVTPEQKAGAARETIAQAFRAMGDETEWTKPQLQEAIELLEWAMPLQTDHRIAGKMKQMLVYKKRALAYKRHAGPGGRLKKPKKK